jgi:site-specific DNA-methyltransferase (adenine-specific)
MTEYEKTQLRQEWRTPDDFYDVVDAEFRFDIDVAASPENAMCFEHISKVKNAFSMSWFPVGRRSAWCNPGFRCMHQWCMRAYEETRRPGVTACVLGPLSNAAWMQFCCRYASEIRDLANPRIQFLPPIGLDADGENNRQDCVLVVFRKTPLNWPGAYRWTWDWHACAAAPNPIQWSVE